MRDRIVVRRTRARSFASVAKHVTLAVLFVIAAGCSGGGCSSGCACGGMTPLAEGFKPAQRIENAASLRLTETGIGFLESNMGTLASALLGANGGQDGVVAFEIPPTSGSFNALITTIKYDVCAAGPKPDANPPECVAEIDLGKAQLKLKPTAPHNLKITGPLPVRLRKLPLTIEYFCLPVIGCAKSNVAVTLTGNQSCGGDQTAADLDLDVTVAIAIDADQKHSRYGYSKVGVDVAIDKEKLKNSITICGGFDATLYNGLLDLIGGLLVDQVSGVLTDQIDQALCMKANAELVPACPSGTQDVGGVCRYGNKDTDECASIVLGTEGRLDLGAALQGISGGASGAFDFLLAGGGASVRNDNSGEHWGDLNPVSQGITLGMYGGAEPSPPSSCVPPVVSKLPTAIPIPDELLGNSVSDWPMGETPHFGLALSERFANYALEQIYNSGALCLGISADTIGTPVTSTILGLGLGAKSLPELGRQKQGANVAFLLRPQKPPTIAFGNGTDIAKDPTFDVRVDSMAIDFYVWSLDRYIRAMTVTTDIQVPGNLAVTPEGLTPVIKEIKLSKTVLSNHDKLLRDDPIAIASALEGLVGQLVGGALGGSLKAIDINQQLAGVGLTLDIPDSVEGNGSPGLRKLTKGTDRYLGIFAALGVAAAPPKMSSSTSVEVTSLDIDPHGLDLDTWTPDNGPRAHLRLGSNLDDGQRALEWQYRIDNGAWHPFTRERDLELTDSVLRNQGVHKVWVRSRVVGDPMSLDPEPKLIELRVDAMAPEIRVLREGATHVRVEAADLVSGDEVTVRTRLGTGESEGDAAWGDWTAWQPALDVEPVTIGGANFIQVEAKDEGENVGTVTEALIRGVAENAASGCQCAVEPGVPTRSGGALGLVLGMALAGGFAARRRARHSRARAVATAARALAALGFIAAVGMAPGCSCSSEDTVEATGCRARGDCSVVMPGLVGAYTSVAVAPDGRVWVAGYLEGNWDPDYGISYGDLVVGAASATGEVAWVVVDGTEPSEVVDPEMYDPTGFRNGKIESGDDVGLWTSIAVEAGGGLGVAYYDVTNHALKYAHFDGTRWTVSTVQSGATGSDYGTYAKLKFLGGKPVIAYHFIEAASAGITSGVRLATGNDATGASWSFEDVAADPKTPCNALLCSSTQHCLTTGACAAKKTGCDTCGSGAECVDDGMGGATCAEVRLKSALITYPNEVGLYVSMGVGADGVPRIAYYDRPHGNVVVATKSGATWTNVVLDGADGKGNDTGDMGIGLSLAVGDKDDLHLAYVDGLSESLVFRTVQGGTTALARELLDDGLGAKDGHHIVGDDANVFVTPGGELRVSYQDATTGDLVLAIGTGAPGNHEWTRQVVPQDGFAGHFSQQIVVNGDYRIANWWRVGNPLPKGDVRFVSP